MERFSRSFHIDSVQGAKVVFPTEYHYRMFFKFRVLTENIQICHLKWSLSRKVALSWSSGKTLSSNKCFFKRRFWESSWSFLPLKTWRPSWGLLPNSGGQTVKEFDRCSACLSKTVPQSFRILLRTVHLCITSKYGSKLLFCYATVEITYLN